MSQPIQIFTDGACLGNPGPGGYGVLLRWKDSEKKISAGYFLTTNNRMELLAAIVGIEALKVSSCNIEVLTDSQYVCQGITQWMKQWKARNFLLANKQPVKNQDLWRRLNQAVKGHTIHWAWVRGHSGHPENELCDKLAQQAAYVPTQEDAGYIQGLAVSTPKKEP